MELGDPKTMKGDDTKQHQTMLLGPKNMMTMYEKKQEKETMEARVSE